jgi:hypothetical protein
MEVVAQQIPGVLRVRVAERTLVKPLDSQAVLDLRRPDTVVIALDLKGADFISSLFLQGCIELARTLVGSGQQLVLLHLLPQQERLLEFLVGTPRLLVLNDEAQLDDRLKSLAAAASPDGPHEGVTRAEKFMLWG